MARQGSGTRGKSPRELRLSLSEGVLVLRLGARDHRCDSLGLLNGSPQAPKKTLAQILQQWLGLVREARNGEILFLPLDPASDEGSVWLRLAFIGAEVSIDLGASQLPATATQHAEEVPDFQALEDVPVLLDREQLVEALEQNRRELSRARAVSTH